MAWSLICLQQFLNWIVLSKCSAGKGYIVVLKGRLLAAFLISGGVAQAVDR